VHPLDLIPSHAFQFRVPALAVVADGELLQHRRCHIPANQSRKDSRIVRQRSRKPLVAE
jgi:hypothetical protein